MAITYLTGQPKGYVKALLYLRPFRHNRADRAKHAIREIRLFWCERCRDGTPPVACHYRLTYFWLMKSHPPDQITDEPGMEERFRRGLQRALNTPPQHRMAPLPKPKIRPPSKGRVHKGKTKR
jgi:hypothetical protein